LPEPLDEGFEPPQERTPAGYRARVKVAPPALGPAVEHGPQCSRIGGTPRWIQGAECAGTCPRCRAPMTFAAELADRAGAEWVGGDDAMLYAFICAGCRVSATFITQY
jgi:hypothetical protein